MGFAPGFIRFAPGFAPCWAPEFEGILAKFAGLPPSGADLFIILKKEPRPGAKFGSMPGCGLEAHQARILIGSVLQCPIPFRNIIPGDDPCAQPRLLGIAMVKLTLLHVALYKISMWTLLDHPVGRSPACFPV